MDTTHLRPLLDAAGPFASIYVDGPHTSEDAAKQRELIARAAHAELEHKGASRELRAVVDQALEGAPPTVAHVGRAVIATVEGIIVDQPLQTPLGRPTYRYSPLPYLLPLVADSSMGGEYVCVFVDAEGADTTAVAEEAIRQNLSETAAAVMEVAAERHRDAPLFLVGEVRSRSQLIAELPAAAQPRLIPLESGSSAKGSDSAELAHELGEHLLRRQLQAMQDAADQFAHAVASQPPLVATEPTEIDMGRSRLFECRADEALPFAAVSIGAAIVGIDQRLGLEHGFGAVLRHPSA